MSSCNFDLFIENSIKIWEGWDTVTDDEDDSGGLTAYGISQKAYPDVDIRSLTAEEAVAIYRSDYWNRVKADQLPEGVDLFVADTAVNMGVSFASKMLQESVGAVADGIIGSKTLKATSMLKPRDILCTMASIRATKYAEIGMKGNNKKFLRGWYNRLMAIKRLATDRTL